MTPDAASKDFIAIGAMLLAAVAFSAAAMVMPRFFGPRSTHGPVKDTPYECGLPPLGGALRFDVKFHVVAMLFILFDVELVFLIGWAAQYRDLVRPAAAGGLGWPAFTGAILFLLILEVGHVYAWRKGALDWTAARSRRQPERTAANPEIGG